MKKSSDPTRRELEISFPKPTSFPVTLRQGDGIRPPNSPAHPFFGENRGPRLLLLALLPPRGGNRLN